MKNLWLGLTLVVPLHTWGARPFVTDDARLTNAGSCQVESWLRTYRDSQESWALPACNPGGNLEITFGAGYARPESGPSSQDIVLQAKTLFKPLQTNGWGWGLGAGMVRHPSINPGPNLLGNSYAYVPVSVSFDDDRFIVHTNLGWLKERATGDSRMTYGVGVELVTGQRTTLIAESFGDQQTRPYWQVGARYSLIPSLLQLDATIGQQLSGSSGGRWVSIGFRYTP